MKFKYIALIGYTGLIGSNFLRQIKQKNLKIDCFNSKNISKINTKNKYDLVFCQHCQLRNGMQINIKKILKIQLTQLGIKR